MSKKEARKLQYLAPDAGFQSISSPLVESAQEVLELALRDRHKPVATTKHNHYSPNALGAIVLLVTAFDVSMNEAIGMSHEFGGRTRKKGVALEPTLKRFRTLAGSSGIIGDVRMLVDLRDEIVHYLPRHVDGKGNVPKWFKPLIRRRLFVSAPYVDFQFSVKLSSYALAYWGWEVAYRALERVFMNLNGVEQSVCDWLLHNFGLYARTCAPKHLPAYDEQHGLKLTAFKKST